VNDVESWLPVPAPKVVGFMREKGKFVRDENGKPCPLYAESNPEGDAVELLRVMVLLWRAMRDDPSVQFSTLEPEGGISKENARAFAEGIKSEFDAFQMTAPDFRALSNAVPELTGVTEEEVEAMKAARFSRVG